MAKPVPSRHAGGADIRPNLCQETLLQNDVRGVSGKRLKPQTGLERKHRRGNERDLFGVPSEEVDFWLPRWALTGARVIGGRWRVARARCSRHGAPRCTHCTDNGCAELRSTRLGRAAPPTRPAERRSDALGMARPTVSTGAAARPLPAQSVRGGLSRICGAADQFLVSSKWLAWLREPELAPMTFYNTLRRQPPPQVHL